MDFYMNFINIFFIELNNINGSSPLISIRYNIIYNLIIYIVLKVETL